MILKEIDKKEALIKHEEYGYKAEKQMAFYLKRAFQDNKDIHVINDLRLEMNDDVAQIDHLIIHRFGFLIVESKSVTSKISINEYGEWTRHYPKFTRGIPSPVNQARRQADFLKNFLMARTEYLLKKSLIFQASVTDFKFDVSVAISDSGIINRAKNTNLSEVHKADQITDAINEIISSYAGTNKNLLTLKVNYQFANSSMNKITRYLIQSHRPKISSRLDSEIKTVVTETTLKPATKITSAEKLENKNDKVCSKCKSENIEIAHGRFGYYFKCTDCNGNTSIKLKCKDDPCDVRLRKQKLNFYKECGTCNMFELYFVNKVIEEV